MLRWETATRTREAPKNRQKQLISDAGQKGEARKTSSQDGLFTSLLRPQLRLMSLSDNENP